MALFTFPSRAFPVFPVGLIGGRHPNSTSSKEGNASYSHHCFFSLCLVLFVFSEMVRRRAVVLRVSLADPKVFAQSVRAQLVPPPVFTELSF